MASETQIQGQPRAAKLAQKAGQEVRPLRTFLAKFSNDWSMTFAGALAYNLITAMLPIAIAIVAVLGFILGGSNSQQILNQITGVLPGINAKDPNLLHSMKQVSDGAGFLALIAIVTAIFGGSRLFIAIESFMSIIYRVRPRKPIRQNLIAIGMMIIFICLTPIMVVASILPNILITTVGNSSELAKIPLLVAAANNPVITYIASFLGGLIAAFILFEAIYFIVPNQRISWRNSWHGALVAGIALELFLTIIFPTYKQYFMSNYVGQIGFAIVLLAFFYYFAVILILGAEVNAFFSEGVQPIPNDLATFVSTMAGKLNKDQPNVESPSHVSSKPTDQADKAHIATAREQEEQIQQVNSQKQASTVAIQQGKKDVATSKQSKRSGKGKTILEVVTGSAIALSLELFRQRQRRK